MSDEKQKSNTKLSPRLAIPFFVVLGVLTVCSFLIPLRPTVSYTEKRELAKFPAFSVEALISGEYFDDITIWFSDTFPGREGWMELSTAINSTHGYSEIAIQGQMPVSVEASPESIEELPQAPEPTASVPAATEATESAEETQAEEETQPEEENHAIDWAARENAAEQITTGRLWGPITAMKPSVRLWAMSTRLWTASSPGIRENLKAVFTERLLAPTN